MFYLRQLLIFLYLFVSFIGCTNKNQISLSFSSSNAPKVSVVVGSGIGYTKTTLNTVSITADKAVIQMTVQNSSTGTCSDAWIPYASSVNVNIANVTTQQFVNVKVRTVDGFESSCTSMPIVLDRTAPVISAISYESNRASRKKTPKISTPTVVESGSGVSKYEIRMLYKDGTVIKDWTEKPATNLMFNFASGEELTEYTTSDQTYSLELRVTDRVGNVSSVVSPATGFLVGPVATIDESMLAYNVQHSAGYIDMTLSKPAESATFIRTLAVADTAIEGLDFTYPTVVPVDVYAVAGSTKLRVYFGITTYQMPRPISTKYFNIRLLKTNNFALDFDNAIISLIEDRAPLPKNPASGYSDISGMLDSVCTKNRDAKLECWGEFWGDNFSSAFGGAITKPTVLSGTSDVVKLQRSYSNHVCYTKADNSLWCLGVLGMYVWGGGDSSFMNTSTALRIGAGTAIDTVIKSESNGSTVFALGFDKQIYQVGPGSEPPAEALGSLLVPHQVPGFVNVSDLSVGARSACAIDQVTVGSFKLKCWGEIDVNGSGTPVHTSTKTEITGITGKPELLSISSYKSELYTGCTVTDQMKVYCWGNNSTLKRGVPLATSTTNLVANEAFPTFTAGLRSAGKSIVSIQGGYSRFCMLLSDRTVWCWGESLPLSGRTDIQANSADPIKLEGLDSIQALSVGNAYANCFLTEAGRVQCLGNNSKGELGIGKNDYTDSWLGYSPAKGITFRDVITLKNATCALATNDDLYCWGLNRKGVLGFSFGSSLNPNLLVKQSTPVLTGVKKISGRDETICALKNDNKFYCWGDNKNGAALFYTNLRQVATSVEFIDTLNFNPVPTLIPTTSVNSQPISGGSVPWFGSGITNFDIETGKGCASLTDNSSIACWGLNTANEIATGIPGVYYPWIVKTAVPETGLTIMDVDVSLANACFTAVVNGGVKMRVYCNGGFSDTFKYMLPESGGGEVQTNSYVFISEVDYDLSAGKVITSLELSAGALCYIYNKEVYCMGNNHWGGMPLDVEGAFQYWRTPTIVPALSGATSLSLSDRIGCATFETGGIKCWGINRFLLNKNSNVKFAPEFVYPLKFGLASKVAVPSGNTPSVTDPQHYCAISSTNDLICWGRSMMGEGRADNIFLTPQYVPKD